MFALTHPVPVVDKPNRDNKRRVISTNRAPNCAMLSKKKTKHLTIGTSRHAFIMTWNPKKTELNVCLIWLLAKIIVAS